MLNGVVGRVEVKGNRSVTGVSGVCFVFHESDVEGPTGLAYVYFVAEGALDGIDEVVGLAIESFFDVKGALGGLDG